MTCQYCTAKNETEDDRCHRCGRRIHSLNQRPSFHSATVTNSSLARSLSLETETHQETPPKPAPGPRIVPPSVSAPGPGRPGPAYQASLFGAQLFDTKGAAKPPREVQKPAVSSSHKARINRDAQQSLDFIGAVPLGNHALKTSVEARIFCHATIAQTPLRVMAAIADFSIGLVGLGVFAATFILMGQELIWTNQMVMTFLAAAIIISLLYRVLFCLGNGDTLGLRWVGLQILDFDGRIPTRKQRFQRLTGGCIGVLAAGLGLLWALFDEERLTWHDHISETFPTIRG